MNKIEMPWHREYPTTLREIEPGRPFFMLNYSGLYMRVNCVEKMEVIRKFAPRADGTDNWDFNNFGGHLPIVNLTTGELSHMSENKPIRVH